jgi:hypothetical protein
VLAKVVGINGPEERIVGILVDRAPSEQRFEPDAGHRRRELKVLGRDVTIGTRAAVPAQTLQLAVVERGSSSCNRIARCVLTIQFDLTESLGRHGEPSTRRQSGHEECTHQMPTEYAHSCLLGTATLYRLSTRKRRVYCLTLPHGRQMGGVSGVR